MRLPLGMAALALTLAGCGAKKPPAGAVGPALRACLDAPTTLPRPPSGTLPCELIPPDLELPGD
jgi:hypothetical protein